MTARAKVAEMEWLKKYGGTKRRRVEHPVVIGNMRAVLDFVIEYIAYFSYPPSFREVALACNLSVGSVYWYMVRLERAGYIRRDVGTARGLAVVQGLVKFDEQFKRGESDGTTVVDYFADGMAGDNNGRVRVFVEGL